MLKTDKLIDPNILSTMIKVEKELKEMGIEAIQQHGSAPEIPANLDSLTDSQLGNLYAQILEYYNYVQYQFALVKSMKVEADNKLKYVVASLKKQKISWETHPLYLETLKAQQHITQKVTMLEAVKTIMSKRLAVLSRHVEIRKLEWEKCRRGDSISRIPTLGGSDER